MNERELFAAALHQHDAAARAAFYAEACDDPVMRARVESMVREHEQLGDFLEPLTSPLPGGGQPRHVPEEAPGTFIGPYKLLERIGEGGMGEVWMAEQREPMQRKVALKIIKAGMDTRQVVARFEAERQALALMDHPNIARVLDGGATDTGRPYFVMELVKGTPIARYCDEHRLTLRERLALFVPVCQAIQHAHQKGIIHRDIKPANVLVAPYDGRPVPKVIDFGVAKATGQPLTERTLYTGFGSVVGTLEYMSPEQAELNNQDIDTRSDIYALGVLLYELLTGTTPLDRQRLSQAALVEMLRVIREEDPPKPSTRLSDSKETLPSIAAQRHTEPARLPRLVRGELDWIVMKALEKDRSRRYDTASGLARDVERYLADEPVQACPPSPWYRFRKFARRNRQPLAIAGLALAFLLLLVAVGGWTLRDRAARREETMRQARESLLLAQQLSREDKLPLARQELAAAKQRMVRDRAARGSLAAEIEAYEAELGRLQRFLGLIDEAHEAEFPPPVPFALLAGASGGAAVSGPEVKYREEAKAVPFLLQALSCYEVLERDDWSTRLERCLLDQDQVAKVRGAVYTQLLWLADDIMRRQTDHRSGGKLSEQAAAEEALGYLHRARVAHPPTTAFYQVRARCLEALGKHEDARRDEDLAQQTPATIAVDHYLLGSTAYGAGDKGEAIKQYEAALRLDPTHYWSLLGIGKCLNKLGKQREDFAVAAAAFAGCTLRRPEHAPPYRGRGFSYFSLGRYEEAEAALRQALRLEPDYPEAHLSLGGVLATVRKLSEAETEFREALRLRPGEVKAHCDLGLLLDEEGKHAEAGAELREALRLGPQEPFVHLNLGVHLLNHEIKHAEAEAEFREAIRLEPNAPLAHANLGKVQEDRGRNGEALDEFRRAEAAFRHVLSLVPDVPGTHRGLADVLEKLGKNAEAEAELHEALRLRPDDPEDHRALAHLMAHTGRAPEAEAEYREALRLRPDYPQAHVNLGKLLSERGKPGEAEAEYREALRRDPGSPEAYIAHFNLGSALLNQGKPVEAEAEYREALRLRPDWPPALEWIGLALRGQDKTAGAVRFYTEMCARLPVAEDPESSFRYNAACSAALAGCGQGMDAVNLDEAERTRLRCQSLDWLRADLMALDRLLEAQPDQACARVLERVRSWERDPDFNNLRGDALARLPDSERQGWQRLWADVEQLIKKASVMGTKVNSAGPSP